MKILKYLFFFYFLLISPALAGTDREYSGNGNFSWGEWAGNILGNKSIAPSKSYALVIGISNFDNYKRLPSNSDATGVTNYLLNEANFDKVHLLTEERVTKQRIEALIQHYSRNIKQHDRFLFYWSGHGETMNFNGTKKGYLPLKRSSPGQHRVQPVSRSS